MKGRWAGLLALVTLLGLAAAPLVVQAQAAGAQVFSSKNDEWKAPELRIAVDEFKRLEQSGEVVVVDVRDPQSYRQGHLPGAVLMTPEELSTDEGRARLKGETRTIVTYCSWLAEQTSARVALTLKKAGITNVRALIGGYEEWVKRGDPVVRGDKPR